MVALSIFLIIETNPLDFVPDYAFFKEASNLTYTEIYYKISHRQLTYTGDEELSSNIKFSIWAKNLATGDSVGDSWERKSIIPSFKEARDRDLEIIELAALSLLPGDCELKHRITDISSGREGIVVDTVSVPTFEGDELDLSWIELASDITPDSTQGQFSKNNLKVVPNPGGDYSITRPIFFAYTEIYNLSQDTLPFEVEYSILDESGTTVKEFPAKQLSKTGRNVVDVGILNIIGLPLGNYRFRVAVTDLGTGAESSRNRNFSVVPFRRPPPPELEKYYDMVEYLIPSKELEFYKSLSKKAKAEYLYQLWCKLDPNPETEENEALAQFAERVKYADERFSTTQRKGRDTDRGRIYIKYGEPDEMKRSGIEVLYKPWESWLYYGGGGVQFVFVDIRGSGDYQLVYSSIPEETTTSDWRSYVDPSIIEFRR